jgi:hypothetical protein
MRSLLVPALSAVFLLGCSVNAARSQSIGDVGLIPRVYGPGAPPVNDAPFSHRYNYYVGPAFNFNGDARALWHQDYLDRLDRAERFGHEPPARPRYGYPPDYDRPRFFGGLGIGIFKHR